jgi:hypothetical protein
MQLINLKKNNYSCENINEKGQKNDLVVFGSLTISWGDS